MVVIMITKFGITFCLFVENSLDTCLIHVLVELGVPEILGWVD